MDRVQPAVVVAHEQRAVVRQAGGLGLCQHLDAERTQAAGDGACQLGVVGRQDAVVGWLDETIADGLPIDELAIDPIREGRMQVVAAASHPLARSRSVSVGELSRARWIVPPPESRTHAAYRRLFVSNGAAPPPVAVECASLHASLRIVSTTRMLAVAPDDAVSAYRRLGMIAALRGRSLDLGHAPLSVFTRRDLPASPAMLALRGALRAGRG